MPKRRCQNEAAELRLCVGSAAKHRAKKDCFLGTGSKDEKKHSFYVLQLLSSILNSVCLYYMS